MFSKALFKQSCKANGTMWAIITFALCFMLACVMLISGNGNIGEVKDSIQDTIITKEIDSQMQKRALSYYRNAGEGLSEFDRLFTDRANDTLSVLAWCSAMPNSSEIGDEAALSAALDAWNEAKPEMTTEVGREFSESVTEWIASMPSATDAASLEEYAQMITVWKENTPATAESAISAAYADAVDALRENIDARAAELGYESDSAEANELLGSVMYSLNPGGNFNDFYTEHSEKVPDDYDYMSLVSHISSGDVDEYIVSEERESYRLDRSEYSSSVFLAANMTADESVTALLEELESYGVSREEYDSFGYTYDNVKHMASTTVVTYQGRLDYELSLLADSFEAGEIESEDAYVAAVAEKKDALSDDVSTSFLSTLPSEVSDALEEIGQADLYTLIVGSIFYKLAGLLLPIIYMIMASNNLVSGQVDSGSMAYVLSTSTKRSTVVFTQAVYLIGSLLAMFALSTVTGCVCLGFVTEEVELTYSKLVLLNVGAFLVLFALSGLCFFTSCIFDRSRRSMAIGGGLSIFALVAAMLGLFGSPVIPSVVRLDSLNNFNYATVISFFDVISIIDGTGAFAWKFAILAVLGILGYIAGSIRFTKKDLPL